MTAKADRYLSIERYPDFLTRACQLAHLYDLRTQRSDNIDFFLIGADFAILFLLERDGASLCYVDLASPQPLRYSLGHFLYAHRRTKEISYPGPHQSLPPSVKIPIELDFLLDLLGSSPDILRGSRDWLLEYQLSKESVPLHWLNDLRPSEQ
jgi:hypothetical protein